MNFLAHAYLSEGQTGIITGNLISDFVKGSKQYALPKMIQKGIFLHRAIDKFTDDHAFTKDVKSLFRSDYRLYAGAFTDIVFDYFLANDYDIFEQASDLERLKEMVHLDLDLHIDVLPEKFMTVFRSMKQYGWLTHYGKDEAIRKSFESLVRRSAFLESADKAYEIFLLNKSIILEAYRKFFPELETFSRRTLQDLISKD